MKIAFTTLLLMICVQLFAQTYNCTHKRDEWNRWQPANRTTIAINDTTKQIVVKEIINVSTVINYEIHITGPNGETMYLWNKGVVATVPQVVQDTYIISIFHEDYLCPHKKEE